MGCVLGIDIGGKTRNGFAVYNEDGLKDWAYIPYDYKDNALNHRKKILEQIDLFMNDYSITNILFERINLYRGGRVSPLANIISLCRVQTSIIDKYSNIVDISDIPVKTWKSFILNSGSADKNDAVRYVMLHYPQVDLNITIEHKRKEDEIVMNHDLADAILISEYGFKNLDFLNKNKLNFT